MTGQDLYADVLKVESHMDEAISDMREYGLAMAERERDYRVSKAKTIANLRLTDKTPVSIVADMANGDEEVADIRLERDKNEVMYKASIERLQKLKREHDLLKVFLTKEL
jgi:hypothetical protein